MKNKFNLILCFLAVLLAITSCNSSKSRVEDSMLWKISGNGLKEPSYLLGTFHTIELEFLDSIPYFWDIYNSLECLIVEADFTDESMPEYLKLFQENEFKKHSMPGDTTYQMLYSLHDYHFIDSVLRARKMFNYQSFMPEFVADEFIDQGVLSRMKGFMDVELVEKAHKDKKEILQLDDWNMLLTYDEPPKNLQVQARILLRSITCYDKIFKEIEAMDSLYRQQKLTSLAYDAIHFRLSKLGIGDLADSSDSLLIKRNRHWLEKIPAFISRKPSLIAVGAAHLIDKEGLILGLRNLGYIVTPVKDK